MIEQNKKSLANYLQTIFTSDFLREAFSQWLNGLESGKIVGIAAFLKSVDWHYTATEIEQTLTWIVKQKMQSNLLVGNCSMPYQNQACFGVDFSGFSEAFYYAQMTYEKTKEIQFVTLAHYYELGDELPFHTYVVGSVGENGFSFATDDYVKKQIELDFD